jgi:hypothetical protein
VREEDDGDVGEERGAENLENECDRVERPGENEDRDRDAGDDGPNRLGAGMQ